MGPRGIEPLSQGIFSPDNFSFSDFYIYSFLFSEVSLFLKEKVLWASRALQAALSRFINTLPSRF